MIWGGRSFGFNSPAQGGASLWGREKGAWSTLNEELAIPFVL